MTADDPFADLDKLSVGEEPKSATPGSTEAPEKSTSKSATETKPETAPDTKPASPAPGSASTEKGDKFSTSKELRAAYDRTKADLTARESRIAELETRLADLEAAGGNTQRLEAHVSEQIEKHKKAYDEAEQKLRLIAYEQSQEFKEKFEDRYLQAEQMALDDIAQLTVADGEGQRRPATKADFLALRRLPLQAAYEKAQEMFGPAAADVMSHRRTLELIARESDAAIKKHREQFAEHQKQESIRQAQVKEARAAQWQKVNQDLANRFDYFRPTKDGEPNHDPEWNAQLAKGFQEADTFFHNRGTLTPQEQVILDARIRNQSAAFRPMVHRAKKQAARIAELEAQVAAYQASEPGETRRSAGGEARKPAEMSPDEAFEKMNFPGR